MIPNWVKKKLMCLFLQTAKFFWRQGDHNYLIHLDTCKLGFIFKKCTFDGKEKSVIF